MGVTYVAIHAEMQTSILKSVYSFKRTDESSKNSQLYQLNVFFCFVLISAFLQHEADCVFWVCLIGGFVQQETCRFDSESGGVGF